MLNNLDPGSALIFKNDKGDNPARPDYTGELQTPEGTQLRIALWIKEGSSGKFFSGKVSELEHVQQEMSVSGGNMPPEEKQPVEDDDIPF